VNGNVHFILVRPLFLGNIGSIARVLKNFGFDNLRLVQPPRNYKDAEARRMSVGAFDILKQAQVFETLSDALKDINVVIGTTSGQQREHDPQPIQTVSPKILSAAKDNQVGLVFGDERNGLSRTELERCHSVITVPTDAEFAALNVAQAVGIIAYELIREQTSEAPRTATYSSGQADDELFVLIDQLLDKVEFSKKFNRVTVLSELRQFYQRAQPTARESDLLGGAMHRINQKLMGP
jgi:tRNA (cytidine32/uridine32-2'-O)-methyltransferase